MTTAIPVKATMPVKDFELDTARISAHFIGGLVNLHTTVDSDEFHEVRATPHCLVYPTKGNTENPWDIHKIGDAIELVINELCDEKAEKHDWRIVYVGTSSECFSLTDLLVPAMRSMPVILFSTRTLTSGTRCIVLCSIQTITQAIPSVSPVVHGRLFP